MSDSSSAASPSNALLEVKGVHREFDEGKVPALRGVSLTIEGGEYVALIGASGSGKSTLLNLLGALDVPDQGEICFRGQSLTTISDPAEFRSRHIGFIFQSFHLLPTLTAVENVQIPMFELGWSKRQRNERACELLKSVGMAHRLDHLPSKLSGGERQRVAIARSLANSPSILLADEPTGNLDTANVTQIMRLLRHMHAERKTTLIVVTHDPAIADSADRVITLRDGLVVSDVRNS